MKYVVYTLLVVALVGIAPAEKRDDIRANAEEQAKSVVTLEIAMSIKQSYGGQQAEQEQRIEGIGFLVGEDGLLVTSLSTVDPGTFYARQSAKEDMQYTTRVKSIKYIMDNRDEIEASVVLRDEDFDLAFLKPLDDRSGMSFVPVDGDVKAKMLQEIYAVSRAPRIARRSPIAMTGEVQSVIDRPRLLYITSAEITSAKVGAPVFTADGKLLGINAYYSIPGGGGGAANDQSYLPVVVPVSDIADIAKLAKDIRPTPIADAPETEETPAETTPTPAEQ